MRRAFHSGAKASQRGFTLIEAVVALALVAVMLAAIGSLIGSAATGTRTLEGHVALVETARLVMTSLPRHGLPRAENMSGEVSGLRWQIRETPFEVDVQGGAAWIPETVAVRVQSPSGAIFTLETVRLAKRPGT
jgi:general secretion pathway protein I